MMLFPTLAGLLFNWKPRTSSLLLTGDNRPVLFRGPAIENVRREMDELMQEFDSIFERNMATIVSTTVAPPLKMKCDVKDEGDTYVVRAELPGVPKDAINVEMLRNVLTIEAAQEKEKETKEKEAIAKVSEKSSFGLFLPDYVLPDTAKTSFEHGVLTVTFAKNQEMVKPRKLLIE